MDLPTNTSFHYIAMLQEAAEDSQTEWHLTWKCGWSESVSLNSTLWRKMAPSDKHSSALAEHFLRPNSECEHSESVGGAFQQGKKQQCHLCWCRLIQVWCAGSHSSLVKIHSKWWRLHWKIVLCSWDFAQSNSVIALYVPVVIPMDINGKHYFRSSLCTS